MFKDKLLKKNKENKSIGNILIFFIIMVSIVFFSIQASAYERPQFKDGLMDNWHPGKICIPCHYTLAGTEKAKAISTNCFKCHANRPQNVQGGYNIDMVKIFNIHKDMVCIRCHVGIKDGDKITAQDFHRVMSKTACLSCHTFENGTYQKPKKTKCSDCHGGDPHVIHGERIEKMCPACHGVFGEKYINMTAPASELPIPLNKSNTVLKDEGYLTIGQFINNIIESFMQILR